MEHLRQHERVTNADRLQEEAVLRFQQASADEVIEQPGVFAALHYGRSWPLADIKQRLVDVR